MELTELGYNNELASFANREEYKAFITGRVIAEHKERYIVRTADGDYDAEITGNLRFSAQRREDFPAVGDWVAVSCFDEDSAIIHAIYPRNSVLKRQAIGKSGEAQLIAANIDFAFLVQACDRDFNINRLERYLTICNAGGIEPIIVLTKKDLLDKPQIDAIAEQLSQRLPDIPAHSISNLSENGFAPILSEMQGQKTYCMLGSSGVGKSTLLNNLMGNEIMQTRSISESTHKGKHTTSHRQLFVLPSGALLVDTPGMREIGITDAEGSLEQTFDLIAQYAEECRYSDCSHTTEKGCAVRQAVEEGAIPEHAYENFLKLEREREVYEQSATEKRQKDKDFGKMMKNYKKDIKKLSGKHKR